MKYMRLAAFGCAVATLVASLIVSPDRAMAEKPPFFDHLYLWKEVRLYNSPKTDQKPIAALSAGQVVTVVDSDVQISWGNSPAWYKVKTWLGDKWLKAEEGAYYTGTIVKEERSVTILTRSELHDYPGMPPNSYAISPQQVKSTATFHYGPVAPTNATSLLMSQEKWIQIDTWIGKKWIREPALLEDVSAESTAYKAKLLEPVTIYPVPYMDASGAETLQPQVVEVTGEWVAGFGPSETTWLRIELPQGERWMTLARHVLTNYRTMDETIKLQTETRYFDIHPGSTMRAESGWLAPGEYEAFEASGDYTHIHTDEGDVWVPAS